MTTTTKPTAQKIPHPPKRVPILGDVLGMDRKRPNQKTLWQFSQLGPLYRRTFIGGVNLTFAGSADLMREVIDEKTWQRHFARPYEKLRAMAGDGLFTAANDSLEWKRGHEALIDGFVPAAMADYHDAMVSVVNLTSQWLGDRRTVTDTAAMMGDAALETIGLAGFGYSVGAFTETDTAGRAPFADALTRVFAYVQESAIPVLGKLTGGKRARQHAADIEFMKRTVLDVIETRRRTGERCPDLLDRMLHPENGEVLPDDNIADQVLTLFIAGHETTGNLLAFTTYFLARDPELAARVRAEAAAVTTDGRIAYEDVAKLKVTEAVISETLRLWPTAPGFFRAARQDTTLGGYDIAADEWVFVLLLAVHRDTNVWGPDAEEFRPDRWLVDGFRPKPWMYRPFGTGPRACIGRAFALHEAKLIIASLLRDFELETSGELDVEENLTLRPSNLEVEFRRIG
ncbi:cytochrome P450 [Nocardia salmonicida]|uniref:cytochrome P450 n=1 Tax=Nocardia salmonicida TaxID=53431 RepID=UPI0007A56134|nr:cytochrome P450 [Nocardia salmonicida]